MGGVSQVRKWSFVSALLWGRVWEVYIKVPPKAGGRWGKLTEKRFHQSVFGSLADSTGDWTGPNLVEPVSNSVQPVSNSVEPDSKFG